MSDNCTNCGYGEPCNKYVGEKTHCDLKDKSFLNSYKCDEWKEKMEIGPIQVQVFNHPAKNGRRYSADNVEEVIELFKHSHEIFVTNVLQGKEDCSNVEKLLEVDLQRVIGKLKDIEVIDEGFLDLNNKPIITVEAKIKLFDNKPEAKAVKDLIDNGVATFGMRAVCKHNTDESCSISKVISYDLISK